jgi:hypothetical protein
MHVVELTMNDHVIEKQQNKICLVVRALFARYAAYDIVQLTILRWIGID